MSMFIKDDKKTMKKGVGDDPGGGLLFVQRMTFQRTAPAMIASATTYCNLLLLQKR
jgi:hypothetical protein